MAKPAARSPSSPSSHFTLRVVVLVVLVALVAAGVVAGWAEWRIRTADPASGTDDLDSAVRAQSRADAQRLEELALVAGRLVRRTDLPLGEEEEDEEEVAQRRAQALLSASLEDVLDEHRVELIVLQGNVGERVFRVGGPEDVAAEMAVSALMDRAFEEGRASGVWSFGERLYLMAAERVEADGETLAAIAVADLVARATAIEARAVSRAEALYLLASGDGGEEVTVVASTLDQAAGEQIVSELESAGVLGRVLSGERGRDPVDVTLEGTSYQAMAAPLAAGAGGASAARVALIETGAGNRQLRMVQAAALAGGLGALLLGLLGAPLVTRGSGSASEEVTEAARAARAGDLAGAARHGVPAPLALFFQEAAEKRALEAVVASLGRTEGVAGGGGDGHPEGHPARSKGAVLAVEMPGYARTPSDQDPREVSERLGRDVVRLRRAVTARNGRLEATLGHRALAVFEGERAGARALGAAAEAMKALSTPENAFDEPTPPAAAVATGTFVAGGPEGARTVSGLPVQQTESLLREASSGDLIVARQAFRELEGELSAGGVQVAAQRGLLTPQPVYLLDAEKAARAAAALGSTEGASAAGLSGLAAGTVLGDRFTLVERRSANPAQAPVWLRYLARDGELDALVTLRALRPGTVVDLTAFEAFDGPLQQAQRAVDPSVERVIAAGESDGVPFLAAERVEGPTLERLLAGLLAERRPLGAAAALRIARTVAAGLAAVHAAGVPHGALRPASVTLDPRGHARLTGLGLALVLPSHGIDPEVDRALGPARYRAPELLAGDEATPASDVYAAGVLLTELFSGRVSEDGAPPEPPDATELPDGLAPILARCLERDPASRYPDAAALAEALEPVRAELLT